METAQRLATVTHSDQTATERVRVRDKQQGRDKERECRMDGWGEKGQEGNKEASVKGAQQDVFCCKAT